MSVRLRASVTAVAASILLAAGCASGPPEGPDASAPPAVLAGLCDAREAAAAGDRDGVDDAFLGAAHEPLHELAQQLADADRRDLSARLLEAKNRVEGPLEADAAPPDDLPSRLTEVLEATRTGLSALDRPTPDC